MVSERVVHDTRVLEAGHGWPVILLHAFPVDADMWRPQLDRVPAGWWFIAPDLRGDTVDAMADNVLSVMDALDIDGAVIGGLSMGGYVTFAMYRRVPERFNGMLLADTRSAADTPEAGEQRTRLIALVREKGPRALADAMLPKLLARTTADAQPELREQIYAMAEARGAEALALALAAMRARPDSTAMLGRISAATLVICGDQDAATPLAEVEAMQRGIPRSRLVVLHGAGHLTNLEQPEEFSTALCDFLTSNM